MWISSVNQHQYEKTFVCYHTHHNCCIPGNNDYIFTNNNCFSSARALVIFNQWLETKVTATSRIIVVSLVTRKIYQVKVLASHTYSHGLSSKCYDRTVGSINAPIRISNARQPLLYWVLNLADIPSENLGYFSP